MEIKMDGTEVVTISIINNPTFSHPNSLNSINSTLHWNSPIKMTTFSLLLICLTLSLAYPITLTNLQDFSGFQIKIKIKRLPH